MKLLLTILLLFFLFGCYSYSDETKMVRKYMEETGRENIILQCLGGTLYYRGNNFFHELAHDDEGNMIDCDD